MRPQAIRKIVAGLITAIGAALLALGIFSAGALAAPSETFTPTSDGPQSANIPYVAWVGEHVRLVACDPRIETSEAEGQRVNFRLEDWSGKPESAELPESESGSQAFFAPSAGSAQAESGDGCVKIDYKSLSPGLGRIRAVVTNDAGTILYSHQFIVIWLTANKPTLSEAGLEKNVPDEDSTFQSQLSGEGHSNLRSYLGDPEGNGEFAPSPFEPETAPNQEKGLVQIKVTGSFPVEAGALLHNVLPEASYTLPESWPTLAKALAVSSEEIEQPGTNPGLWDIHGTPSEGGNENASEPSNDPLTADYWRPAFDNYTSGATATIGPFDPQAPNETLLSDNRLNADDAPMPSIRVDVHIAKNEGGADLGGVGKISGASKALIYSHNFNGDATESGNLYNPYYGEYLPATARPEPQASGVDGPSHGGDFPGFLNEEQPYTFWTSVHSQEDRSAESTGCTRSLYGGDDDSTDYETPSGPLTESFYTDERGEAYVTYTPGDGFYLNHIPTLEKAGEEEAGKIVKNSDGGCDLKNLYKAVIGESSITATAVYPYQPVDFTSQPSANTLVKKVRSYWEKEFYAFPKGPGSNEQNVRIVVAKAQDIDGNPIPDELVCFGAQQEAKLFPFSNPTNGDRLADPEDLLGRGSEVYLGESYVPFPWTIGTDNLCEFTNYEGLAGIDVDNSTAPSVDVTARYEDEAIIRDHLVSFTGNIGSEELRKAEEKAAEEKKIAEEKAKAEREAERKAAEEAAKAEREAERKAAEEKAKVEHEAAETKQREREIASEKARQEREQAAEKRAHEREEAKEKEEKKTEAEIEAANKRRAEEEAATKKRDEEELAKRKTEIESLAKPLVSPIAGSPTDPPKSEGKKGKAHTASKKKGKKKSTKGKHHKK